MLGRMLAFFYVFGSCFRTLAVSDFCHTVSSVQALLLGGILSIAFLSGVFALHKPLARKVHIEKVHSTVSECYFRSSAAHRPAVKASVPRF